LDKVPILAPITVGSIKLSVPKKGDQSMSVRPVIFSVYLLLATTILPGFGQAEVDTQTRNTIRTGQPPLDVQVSADGNRTFILTKGGRLEIYDNNAKIIDTIKVDPATNTLSTDGTGGRIFLGSSKNSKVTEMLIEYVAKLSYDGSPFKGNIEAPVVLAVFSDFQ
jgi:hypothetical protein